VARTSISSSLCPLPRLAGPLLLSQGTLAHLHSTGECRVLRLLLCVMLRSTSHGKSGAASHGAKMIAVVVGPHANERTGRPSRACVVTSQSSHDLRAERGTARAVPVPNVYTRLLSVRRPSCQGAMAPNAVIQRERGGGGQRQRGGGCCAGGQLVGCAHGLLRLGCPRSPPRGRRCEAASARRSVTSRIPR
jgi:hypothetical protein